MPSEQPGAATTAKVLRQGTQAAPRRVAIERRIYIVIVTYRKTPVPLLYTKLPFVRVCRPMYGDCAHDPGLVDDLILVARGVKCPTLLEMQDELIIRCDIPDFVLEPNGTRDSFLHCWQCFHWKVHDVAWWFLHGVRLADVPCPSQTMSLEEAGITSEALGAIGAPTSCIPLLRERRVDEYTDANGRRRHLFTRKQLATLAYLDERVLATPDCAWLETIPKTFGTDARHAAGRTKQPGSISCGLRYRIFRRDRYRCAFCRHSDTAIQVHHIIPRSFVSKLDLHGSLFDAEYNLITACTDCNSAKSDRLTTDDIRCYIDLFGDPAHPNHRILPYLRRLSDLQSLE